MISANRNLVFVTCCVLLGGCAKDEPSQYIDVKKETFPVTGHVYVDGQPAYKVFATCHNVKETKAENTHTTLGLTDEEGKLEFSTYQSGDGIPEGEYALTFEWGEWDDYWKRFSGPDKLNRRYSDSKKSEFRFTVRKGVPTDLGTIELSTK